MLEADDEEGEDEEEDGDYDDEEGFQFADDGVEGVSPATRAKLLAVRLKQAARKILRDLGRILAISLLALAGRSAHCPLWPVWGTAAHYILALKPLMKQLSQLSESCFLLCFG